MEGYFIRADFDDTAVVSGPSKGTGDRLIRELGEMSDGKGRPRALPVVKPRW